MLLLTLAGFAPSFLYLVAHERNNRSDQVAMQAAQGAFAVRLKDTVDPDAVQADLASVIQRALEPAHVSMWLNNGKQASGAMPSPSAGPEAN